MNVTLDPCHRRTLKARNRSSIRTRGRRHRSGGPIGLATATQTCHTTGDAPAAGSVPQIVSARQRDPAFTAAPCGFKEQTCSSHLCRWRSQPRCWPPRCWPSRCWSRRRAGFRASISRRAAVNRPMRSPEARPGVFLIHAWRTRRMPVPSSQGLGELSARRQGALRQPGDLSAELRGVAHMHRGGGAPPG